jgi:ABC transporter family protein
VRDADLVTFGRYSVSNPDLPKRIELGLPLDAHGYTDYHPTTCAPPHNFGRELRPLRDGRARRNHRNFAGRAEGEGDGDGSETDAERADIEPEVAAVGVVEPAAGPGTDRHPQSRGHVIGYMKDFLFRPEQARTPVGVLSGGERARLILARAFARPSNLLVLDEPTNDLDLETLDLLQEKLADYAGTVLLVSHDRDFLDRVVTSVVASEGNGRWIEYAGGYTDMLAQRAEAPPGSPPTKARCVKQAQPAPQISQ